MYLGVVAMFVAVAMFVVAAILAAVALVASAVDGLADVVVVVLRMSD